MMEKSFFAKPTIEVAKNLLGCYLVNEVGGRKAVGKIVETEAYLEDDPASHSFRGKTARNSVMFDKAGKVYVYFTYGNYWMFNVTTGKEGKGEAVLIRALEPVSGIREMKKRRKKGKILDLCSGPGKLVIALGIKKKDNGKNLLSGKLRIEKGDKIWKIISSERVGISKGKELMYRFYIKDNEFVSRRY